VIPAVRIKGTKMMSDSRSLAKETKLESRDVRDPLMMIKEKPQISETMIR